MLFEDESAGPGDHYYIIAKDVEDELGEVKTMYVSSAANVPNFEFSDEIAEASRIRSDKIKNFVEYTGVRGQSTHYLIECNNVTHYKIINKKDIKC